MMVKGVSTKHPPAVLVVPASACSALRSLRGTCRADRSDWPDVEALPVLVQTSPVD